jgi:hypothetical protein
MFIALATPVPYPFLAGANQHSGSNDSPANEGRTGDKH